MSDVEVFLEDSGNIKFRSFYRDSMYFVIRDKYNIPCLKGMSSIFYAAFAIGYHFDKQEEIASKAINHVNLVSLDMDVKELMVSLILKRKPSITDSKSLWKEVEKYAEYGIQVLFNSLNDNDFNLDIPAILEENAK